MQEVSGGRFATAITERPVPLGAVVGHGAVDGERHLRSRSRTTTTPASAPGSSKASVSCRSPGSPPVTRTASPLRCSGTRAPRSGSRSVQLSSSSCSTRGPPARAVIRRVIIGPDHPYFAGGLPMDAPGVGLGQNDGFDFQARAFLEEVAGIDEADSLPRNASFDEGVHNMEILAAVAESAANDGAAVQVTPQRAEVTR